MKIHWLLLLLINIANISQTKLMHSLETQTITPQTPPPSINQEITSNKFLILLIGFLIGPLLFIYAVLCLCHNEKKASIDLNRLQLASEICRQIDANNSLQINNNNGSLVCVSGKTKTSNILRQPSSGISVPNTMNILTHVQVLQWRRSTKRTGPCDLGAMQLEWVDENKIYEEDKYNDPKNWFISSKKLYNPEVYLGMYHICPEIINECKNKISFKPNMDIAYHILDHSQKSFRVPVIKEEFIYFFPINQNVGTLAYSRMKEEQSQEIQGTLRVRFQLCHTGDLTVCAKSQATQLVPFSIEQYEGQGPQQMCCSQLYNFCYEFPNPISNIYLIEDNLLSKEEIFAFALKKIEKREIKARLVPYFLMVTGACIFFLPVLIIIEQTDVHQGSISSVLFFVALLAAFLVCIPISLLVISVIWRQYHPRIAIILLIIGALGLTFLLIYHHCQKQQEPSATTSHFMSLIRPTNS